MCTEFLHLAHKQGTSCIEHCQPPEVNRYYYLFDLFLYFPAHKKMPQKRHKANKKKTFGIRHPLLFVVLQRKTPDSFGNTFC